MRDIKITYGCIHYLGTTFEKLLVAENYCKRDNIIFDFAVMEKINREMLIPVYICRYQQCEVKKIKASNFLYSVNNNLKRVHPGIECIY
jgi:hypothetical protein